MLGEVVYVFRILIGIAKSSSIEMALIYALADIVSERKKSVQFSVCNGMLTSPGRVALLGVITVGFTEVVKLSRCLSA